MTDDDQIRATVLDYFHGWFEADASRMANALHPELVKRWAGDTVTGIGTVSTRDGMVQATAAGRGKELGGGLAITVVDVHRNMALVLATGGPYREYLHLLHDDTGWRIVGSLWQFEGEAA